METKELYRCAHIGVAGTTATFIRHTGGIFEARVGIAILGNTNMSIEELKNANPFNDSFHDNYASGTGTTEDVALANMDDDCHNIANSIWI